MLQEQVLGINFGQGIDTKTDPKLVMNGKLTVLRDGIFTQAKQLAKRNGYTKMTKAIFGSASLISNPKMIKAYKSETILSAIDSVSGIPSLYSYSQTENAWINKGYFESLNVSSQKIQQSADPQQQQTWAQIGNVGLFAYSGIVSNSSNFGVFIVSYDMVTGTRLSNDFLIGQGSLLMCPKIIVMGSNFGLFYSLGNDLVLKLISISVSGITIGSPITISSNIAGYVVTDLAFGTTKITQFDVVATPTGAALIVSNAATGYGTANKTNAITINNAGAVLNTLDLGNNGVALPLSISLEPTSNNLWFFYSVGSYDMRYQVTTSALASVLTETVISTSTTPFFQSTSISTSAHNQTYFCSLHSADVNMNLATIQPFTLTDAGVVTPKITIPTVDIMGNPFIYSGNIYLPVVYQSLSSSTPSNQDTCFILNYSQFSAGGPSNWAACAKLAPGKATRAFSSLLSNCILVSSNKYAIALPVVEEIISESNSSGATNYPIINTELFVIDFNHANSNQGLQTSDSLILGGGVVNLYDGAIVSELGFNLFPLLTGTIANTGGSLEAGIYTYFAVYQWTDNNGNIHQSAPSASVALTTTGTGLATLLVSPYVITSRANHLNQIVIYRTDKNGTVAKLSEISLGLEGFTDAAITFLDYGPSAVIDSNQILYTSGGIIENIAPPSSNIMVLHNDRVWLVDSQNQESIWYSKSISQGVGVSFSDLLSEQITYSPGSVTGLAEMDAYLVILLGNNVFLQSGDGPNDAGVGSTLSNPQIVPSDTGCNSAKSVISMPMGVMFKSPKGIYLLSRALQVQYFGPEVEEFNSQNIVSAVMINNKNHIRLLTDSGYTIIYDYFFGQWGTFSNHEGVSADICSGSYSYLRNDGNIYQESTTTFLDDTTAYSLYAQTAPLKFSQVQGFQRLRRFAMLGTFKTAGGHGLTISTAYDWSTSFINPVPFLFSGSNGVFQYRERVSIQKCDVIQFLIQEVTTGASGESVTIADMGMEVGVKRGLNKLGPSRTVG